jgi:hypothetical protein
MSIPELDLNFHSYCSINIATASDTTDAEFNPFADGSYGSGATKNIVKTPDIVYDSTAGSLSFGASGTYFIVFAGPLISGSTDSIVLKIKHNGTDVVVSDDLRHRTSMSPKSGIVNCMLTVQAGDNVTVTVDGTHADCQTGAGTHVTVVKANGHFAGAFYTANANFTTASGPYPIFDTANEGGTVVSNTNGITYSDTNGHFTASANRRFLLFSSWILEGNSAIVGAHSFMRDPGSGAVVVDSLGLGIRSTVDPICHTYHMVKSIGEDDIVTDTFSQTGTPRNFTIDKGTGFCMLDISNDGTNPSAHLSLSLNVDSDAFSTTSGDIDIFDAGNTSSGFGTSNHTSTAGVTYESGDGTFTIAQSGDYLVILTVALDDTTSANTLTLKVNVDSATYYSVGYETLSTCDPVSYPISLVMSLEAGAVLNFLVNNAGAKIDDGSSVSIVRLDDVGGSDYLLLEDGFLSDTPDSLIQDDFDINTHEKQDQRYRHVDQAPTILSSEGPPSIRGRAKGVLPFVVSSARKKGLE